MFRPNPSSGIPIYLQVMEQVKDALETGAFRPGDAVPGIRPLAEELVINPNAVARAYRELEQERVIALRQGAAAGLVFTNQLAERPRTAVSRRSSRELALENSRLTAQIAAEVANRVQRNRELDLARDVQQRLFPQVYPQIPGLDYAGACRPALGVGGDYYDFIRLSDAELGIAIGDVSGKGIHAPRVPARSDTAPRDRSGGGDGEPESTRVRKLRGESVRHLLLRPVRFVDAGARVRECGSQSAAHIPDA